MTNRAHFPSRINARRKMAMEQVERRIKEKKAEGVTKDEHEKRVNCAKEEKAILESRIKG